MLQLIFCFYLINKCQQKCTKTKTRVKILSDLKCLVTLFSNFAGLFLINLNNNALFEL